MNRNYTLTLVIVLLGLLPKPLMAETLTLDGYLKQVTSKNLGYGSKALRVEAAHERLEEAKVAFKPSLSAEGRYTDDKRPSTVIGTGSVHSLANRYSIGVNQQTRYGLKARAAYNIERREYLSKVSGNEIEDTYENSVSLELTQSLWKNAFGRLNRLEESLLDSGSQSDALSNSFEQLSILTTAEIKYWQLAVARELSRHIKESLSRTTSLRNWQKKRVEQRLADASELLQAEASVKTKERDLNNALHEERMTGLEFNMLRDRENENVADLLSLPSLEELFKIEPPKRRATKLDVEAAKYRLEAARAKYEISREQYQPSLDLFGNASLYGRDHAFSNASEDSFSTTNPVYSIGLTFSMLLDQGTTRSLRSAYAKEIKAAELEFEQRKRNDELEWRKLVQDLDSAKRRLKENLEIEKIQLEKFQNEQTRYKQGRSTNYQLFVYEQDLFASQVSRVDLIAAILSIRTQMKLFEGVQ